MWEFLSGIWGEISDSAIGQATGSLYDTVSGYAGDAYDYVTGGSNVDANYMDNPYYFDTSNSTALSGVKTALDFAGGFMEVVAPPGGSPTQMPSSKKRRVSAPNSTASAGQFNVSKSNMANLQFGYTPRVNDAIIKANASKVPSIEMAVAQMMDYKGSRGATIKLQGAKPPSVAARTKLPSFAPKYYG